MMGWWRRRKWNRFVREQEAFWAGVDWCRTHDVGDHLRVGNMTIRKTDDNECRWA